MTRTATAIGITTVNFTASTDGWCQLLPSGRFLARDGRPLEVPDGWLMSEEIAGRMINAVSLVGQDVLIDYEHNQLRKDKGLPPEALIAAGWFNANEMQWRDGQGLFIKPRWTPAAQQRIDNGEFAFLSAVFPYDAAGIPLSIRMAALTNDPGVTGMQKLAALAAELPELFPSLQQHEDIPMNEKLRQLLARLGITLPDAAATMTDEQATTALSALDAIKGKADKHDELVTNVVALSAEIATLKKAAPPATTATPVDLTQYVPVETYNALRSQFADVAGQHSTATLSAVLDDAEKSGRIFKSERAYYEQLGGQVGVAALSAQLTARQPIAALTAMQTQNTPSPPRPAGVAVLSADEAAAAKALGITDAEFIKIRDQGAAA